MQQTSPIDIITQQIQTLSLEQLLQVRENINALISEKSPRFSAYLGSDHTETTYQAVVTDANYYTADILDSTIRDQVKASVKAFLQKHQIKAEINQPINQIYKKIMPQGKHSTLQIRLADTINQAGFPLFSWLKLGQHF